MPKRKQKDKKQSLTTRRDGPLMKKERRKPPKDPVLAEVSVERRHIGPRVLRQRQDETERDRRNFLRNSRNKAESKSPKKAAQKPEKKPTSKAPAVQNVAPEESESESDSESGSDSESNPDMEYEEDSEENILEMFDGRSGLPIEQARSEIKKLDAIFKKRRYWNEERKRDFLLVTGMTARNLKDRLYKRRNIESAAMLKAGLLENSNEYAEKFYVEDDYETYRENQNLPWQLDILEALDNTEKIDWSEQDIQNIAEENNLDALQIEAFIVHQKNGAPPLAPLGHQKRAVINAAIRTFANDEVGTKEKREDFCRQHPGAYYRWLTYYLYRRRNRWRKKNGIVGVGRQPTSSNRSERALRRDALREEEEEEEPDYSENDDESELSSSSGEEEEQDIEPNDTRENQNEEDAQEEQEEQSNEVVNDIEPNIQVAQNQNQPLNDTGENQDEEEEEEELYNPMEEMAEDYREERDMIDDFEMNYQEVPIQPSSSSCSGHEEEREEPDTPRLQDQQQNEEEPNVPTVQNQSVSSVMAPGDDAEVTEEPMEVEQDESDTPELQDDMEYEGEETEEHDDVDVDLRLPPRQNQVKEQGDLVEETPKIQDCEEQQIIHREPSSLSNSGDKRDEAEQAQSSSSLLQEPIPNNTVIREEETIYWKGRAIKCSKIMTKRRRLPDNLRLKDSQKQEVLESAYSRCKRASSFVTRFIIASSGLSETEISKWFEGRRKYDSEDDTFTEPFNEKLAQAWLSFGYQLKDEEGLMKVVANWAKIPVEKAKEQVNGLSEKYPLVGYRGIWVPLRDLLESLNVFYLDLPVDLKRSGPVEDYLEKEFVSWFFNYRVKLDKKEMKKTGMKREEVIEWLQARMRCGLENKKVADKEDTDLRKKLFKVRCFFEEIVGEGCLRVIAKWAKCEEEDVLKFYEECAKPVEDPETSSTQKSSKKKSKK